MAVNELRYLKLTERKVRSLSFLSCSTYSDCRRFAHLVVRRGAGSARSEHPVDVRLQRPGVLVAGHLSAWDLLWRVHGTIVPSLALPCQGEEVVQCLLCERREIWSWRRMLRQEWRGSYKLRQIIRIVVNYLNLLNSWSTMYNISSYAYKY
jgi:hypothetical protein